MERPGLDEDQRVADRRDADPGYTDLYAQYLVRTVQALRDRGIPVSFMTLGNEPKYSPPDYPGMLLSPDQEAALATSLSRQLTGPGSPCS